MKRSQIIRSTFLILIVSGFLLPSRANAQDSSLMNHSYSVKSQYLFDNFVRGTATLKSGGFATARFNYNVVSEEMQFIEDGTIKDLVAENIESVEVNDIIFWNIRGDFYQVIRTFDDLHLCELRQPDLSNLKASKGAYGTSTSTSSAVKVSNVPLQNVLVDGAVNLSGDTSEEIEVYSQYYIRTPNHEFIKPTRRKIRRHFREHSDQIKSYIKKHDLNLDKESNLIEVLKYAHSLKKE